MAMPPNPQPDPRRIYITPIEVAKRLDELGLREATLIDAVMNGIHYRLDSTEHSCKTALGMVVWNFATQALRDALVPNGWSKDSTRNYEITVHPEASHAVTVSSGDENTGAEDHTPCTSGEKGQCTKDAIERNLQLGFARISPGEFPPQTDSSPETWVLLYHMDEKQEEIRIELSLPSGLNADDHINDWYERIILTVQQFGDVLTSKTDPDDDDVDEIDFDVERKAL